MADELALRIFLTYFLWRLAAAHFMEQDVLESEETTNYWHEKVWKALGEVVVLSENAVW